jgi:hypothetical protein
MKFRLQLVAVSDAGQEQVHEVGQFEREGLAMETLGLTLAEGKLILKNVQERVVQEQISDFLAQQRRCPDCGQMRSRNGNHDVTMRTVFGKMEWKSPRLRHCPCQQHEEKTFSPLQRVLPEQVSPELRYLEVKWGALLAYQAGCDLLHEVLPVHEQLNAETMRQHMFEVAERLEQELGEERPSLIEGSPDDWEHLPIPNGPLTVGLDGGFVRARHKRGCFEVIVGKSILEFRRDDPEDQEVEKSTKRFGFVQTYDEKPRRRVFEVLKSQDLAMNQRVTFLSDGGDDVRKVQQYLSPEAEYLLDWFHITMRITVMKQMARGLAAEVGTPAAAGEPEKSNEKGGVEKELQSLKWNLWHGNVDRAQERITDLQWELEITAGRTENGKKLLKQLREFEVYVRNNQDYIPNYGERYRNGERISTGFVESTVNQVVSKRMVKKQQMAWTERGAHLLLQVRTRVLNGDLEDAFRCWYPKFRPELPTVQKAA